MFITLFMFTIIVAYMMNGAVGMLLMGCATVYVLRRKVPVIYKMLYLCVTSLPFSYIGIGGMEMHHIVSWTNTFVLVTIFSLLYIHRGIIKNRVEIVVIICLLFILLSINNLINAETSKSIIEIIQLFLMLIPVAIIHGYRYDTGISECEITQLMLHYSNICVATALATVVQGLMYFRLGREVGFITVTSMGNRVICNCLFKGMSILSIFLGVGFVILMLNLGASKNKGIIILKMAVIVAGIIVNTSRTGLAGIAIVFILYYGVNFLRKGKISIIFGGIIGIFFLSYAASKLSLVRGNFFAENGRIITWKAGIRIWTDSIENFLLGAGFEDSIWNNIGSMTSHNMLIQSLAQCGLIGTFLFISLFFIYVKKIIKSKYIYIIIFLITTGMMVTDFYANSFTTIALCLVDIAGATRYSLGTGQKMMAVS